MGEKQSDQNAGKRALGISFIGLGVSLCITFAVTLGPAFMGIGLPFAVLGFIFLPKSGEVQENEEQQ